MLFLALLLAGTAFAEPARWHETLSPHFQVSHESPFAPAGMTLELEKLHNRLRLDLSMFAPWMAKERVRLFLYKDQSSYLRGRFKPPQWSNGIAFYQDRTVASFVAGQERAKLMQVLAHETTHLLFEGYWGEQGKSPPVWLNEGLAMMEESDEDSGAASDWREGLESMGPESFIPMPKFLAIVPTRDLKEDREGVTTWYVQAYGVARFLYRRGARLQFQNFCAKLREGRSLDDALWTVYRLRGAAGLEKEFHASLKGGRRFPRASLAVPKPPAAKPRKEGLPRTLKPVGFGSLVPGTN